MDNPLSPQNLALGGQRLLQLSPLVLSAKLMLDGRRAELLGGDEAVVTDVFVRCICPECQQKDPVYVPSVLTEEGKGLDSVRKSSSIMSLIDFTLHCRPGLNGDDYEAVVDEQGGGDGLALRYILVEPTAARDGKPMYLEDAMQVMGRNAENNHSLTGKTVYVYHWNARLYTGTFRRAVVREFNADSGNHMLQFEDQPAEADLYEVNMGLNYIYVCSRPDEPPPRSPDDMTHGLPRVGPLIRPEGYDTTRTMDSIPGLPPAAPITPPAASAAATHSNTPPQPSLTSHPPPVNASASQRATSSAPAPAGLHQQVSGWAGMPTGGASTGGMAGGSTAGPVPSAGGMMQPAGGVAPGMSAPWQAMPMQGMLMPGGMPMVQHQGGPVMMPPPGGSALVYPQLNGMAGMPGGGMPYQHQQMPQSLDQGHGVAGTQSQGGAIVPGPHMPLYLYPPHMQPQVLQQQQQQQQQPGAPTLLQSASTGAQGAAVTAQPISATLNPPPFPSQQQQQQQQQPSVNVKMEPPGPGTIQGQVQQPIQQRQLPVQAVNPFRQPSSPQLHWPWLSGPVCASRWPQEKVFSLPALEEVTSQFPNDVLQVSYHLTRGFTSVLNLLYEPNVPTQFVGSWVRLGEGDMQEMYSKLVQACGAGQLVDILSRRPQIEDVLMEIQAKGQPRAV